LPCSRCAKDDAGGGAASGSGRRGRRTGALGAAASQKERAAADRAQPRPRRRRRMQLAVMHANCCGQLRSTARGVSASLKRMMWHAGCAPRALTLGSRALAPLEPQPRAGLGPAGAGGGVRVCVHAQMRPDHATKAAR
jgi:hypothetical protein